MTGDEMDALYLEGKHYYRLSHIPKGKRDRAIHCVGFYLFRNGFGYGQEEQRLELLRQWFFDRAVVRSQSRKHYYDGCLYRAVNWKSPNARPISERTIDRLTSTKTLTLTAYKYANRKRENEARQKIKDAHARLVAEGLKVGTRAMMRESGCNTSTLYRHQDLWRLSNVIGEITMIGVQGEQKKESASVSVLPVLDVCPIEIQEADLSAKPAGVLILMDRKGGISCSTNVRTERNTALQRVGSAALVSLGQRTHWASRCHSPPAPS